MSRVLLILFLSLIVLSSCSDTLFGDLVITNTNIIDVQTGEIIPNQDVVIIGDSIAAIKANKHNRNYEASEVVDGTDKYLIPGLWDMHTHTLTDYRYKHNIPIQIAYGITGFRDMGGSVKLRDSIQKLEEFKGLPIPRMMLAGYILGGDPGRDGGKTATIEEARYHVDLLAQAGVDHIKIYYYLHPEVYLAVIEQADKYGLTVQGHVPLAFGIQQASELGQKSIEHMSAVPYWCTPNSQKISETIMATWHDGQEGPSYFNELLDQAMGNLDTTVINQLAHTLKQNNTYLCPTMSTYEYLTNITDPEYSASPHLELMNPIEKYYFNDDLNWSKGTYMKDSVRGYNHLKNRKIILKRLYDQGAPIIAGTDAGVAFHGTHLHKELEIYVEIGLTELQALKTATINPAKFLNLEHKLGAVKEGKWADLVILDRNPLKNIKNTRSIAGVVAQGKYADRQEIDQVLDAIRTQFAKTPIIDTVKVVMERKGLDSALQLARVLNKERPNDFIFDGQQFVTYAIEIWDEDHLDEVKKLLNMELELNPDEQWYPLLQLGGLYRRNNQPDSARIIYERMLKYYGPTELRAQSYLRRLNNPDYGKQVAQEIPDTLKEKLSSVFIDENQIDYTFRFYQENLVIESDQKTDTMIYVGSDVFRKPDNYHDRLVKWNDNTFLKMDFDYVQKLKGQ